MSRMKKAAALLLVAILVLATASVAFGRHAKGIYRTKPPANRTTFLDLSFTATKTKVKRVRYSYRVSGGCSSGASPVGDETDYIIPAGHHQRPGEVLDLSDGVRTETSSSSPER